VPRLEHRPSPDYWSMVAQKGVHSLVCHLASCRSRQRAISQRQGRRVRIPRSSHSTREDGNRCCHQAGAFGSTERPGIAPLAAGGLVSDASDDEDAVALVPCSPSSKPLWSYCAPVRAARIELEARIELADLQKTLEVRSPESSSAKMRPLS